MPNLTIDLCKLALILWSGMLIISGSIWILTSQIRRLGDILEDRTKATAAGADAVRGTRAHPPIHPPVTATRRLTRTVSAGYRDPEP